MAINHDALYKAVINEFFLDFLQLFFPTLAEDIDPASIKEKEQEVITDLLNGQTLRVDILREVQFKGESNLFLILIEPQSYDDKEFGERLFNYLIALYAKYKLKLLPIAVLSYTSPKTRASNVYEMAVKNIKVFDFYYQVIQLNQLHWQNFAERGNPVAAAFMAQMQVGKKQRVRAKVAALEQVVDLPLNPAQQHLLSGFVDTYLTLNEEQQTEFQQELDKLERGKKEKAMEIVTSWMRDGIKQGKLELVQNLLTYRFGPLSEQEEASLKELNPDQLETLGEDFLDFKEKSDLTFWLDAHTAMPTAG